MKERFQERWGVKMMTGYCWCLKSDEEEMKQLIKLLKEKVLP